MPAPHGGPIGHHVIDVNLHGTFYMSQTFARLLVARGDGGSIVNISSIGGKLMSGNLAAYGASKAAVHAVTSSMAKELGRYGIRVNAICPGIVDTSRMDDVPRGERWEQLVATSIPLGRAGTGEDVAWMVLYLCSDQGSWVSGQAWNVDGGQLTIR
jgi:3-oxoacyl-[acyl-carrier protein] reductase